MPLQFCAVALGIATLFFAERERDASGSNRADNQRRLFSVSRCQLSAAAI